MGSGVLMPSPVVVLAVVVTNVVEVELLDDVVDVATVDVLPKSIWMQ